MSIRECDHCSDHTAELMSLVDHEFTGDEVRAINKYMADLEAKHAAEVRELKAKSFERVEVIERLHGKLAEARAMLAEVRSP